MYVKVEAGITSLKEYCSKNKNRILLLGFFLLLAYGIKVFQLSISHDTEAMIAVPDDLYHSWLQMGRFGELFLKKILGTYSLNVYVAAFMMVIGMIAVSVLWGYLFYVISGSMEKISLWIFGSVFFTSMITAEQFSFLLQSYEVTVAMGLTAAALILYLDGLQRKTWYKLILAVLMLMIAFAVYQAMVVLYIATAAMTYLVFYESNREKAELKTHFIYIGQVILLFLCAYVFYSVANKILLAVLNIETTPYITGQIAWKTQGIVACISNIGKHIAEVLTGSGIFYTAALLVMMVLFLIRIVIGQKGKHYWLYVLAALFVYICPFLMTIVLGEKPTIRTELNIPFVTAFLTCMSFEFFGKKKKILYWVMGIGIFAMCMSQAQQTSRLFYTEYVQAQEDYMLAAKITNRIELLDADTSELPVVFIGSREAERNKSCYSPDELELTGYSFFELSFGTAHGTWVMQHYLETLGIHYVYPDQDQMIEAEQEAADMPSWPASDSVKKTDHVVIVKLSDM